MAEIILHGHPIASGSPPRKPSKDWYKRFLKRHEEIQTVFSRQLENKRARAHDTSVISDYFDLFHREKLLKDVNDENTWNFDEKGFLMGYGATSKVIIPCGSKSRFVTHDGNRELSTVIECISANGRTTPPFIIFKGKTHLLGRYEDADIPKEWQFDCSPRG